MKNRAAWTATPHPSWRVGGALTPSLQTCSSIPALRLLSQSVPLAYLVLKPTWTCPMANQNASIQLRGPHVLLILVFLSWSQFLSSGRLTCVLRVLLRCLYVGAGERSSNPVHSPRPSTTSAHGVQALASHLDDRKLQLCGLPPSLLQSASHTDIRMIL